MYCFSINNSNLINSDASDVIFNEKADIFIAGMGTAGAIAAICAAETGLDVIGADRLTGMGGIGTFGCVWDYYYGSYGGRFEKINYECRIMQKQGYAGADHTGQNKSYPAAIKSYVLERNALKAGCRLWYETVVTGVYINGNRNEVVGLRCLKNGKIINVKTGVVIDSTSKAAVCQMAGCAVSDGRESDGMKLQASRPIARLHNGGYVGGTWKHIGRIEHDNAEYISNLIVDGGTKPPCLNDKYNVDKITDRIVFGCTILGVRESKCIKPEEPLRFCEYINGKRTDKPVYYSFSQVDNLNCRDIAFESDAQQEWHLIASMNSYGISAGIPMGALIPKDMDGIIAAGLGIGCDHDFVGSLRMKKDLEKCGEAAANIAYLSVRDGVRTKDVRYRELKEILESSGCLNEANDTGICDLRMKVTESADGTVKYSEFKNNEPIATESDKANRERAEDEVIIKTRWKSVMLITDPDEIYKAFQTGDTSLAMWSVRQSGANVMLPRLSEWLESKNTVLVKNSAIAAGLLGSVKACPFLRKMLDKRTTAASDHQCPQPFDHTLRIKALCLLGRLGDRLSAELMLDIVESRAARFVELLETNSVNPTKDDYAFQYISMAIVSLIKIANVHPDICDMIMERLKKWAEDKSYSIKINVAGGSEMSGILQNYIKKSISKMQKKS